ncbi:Uncharacterized conserved protein YbjT, contains NAD(P)-binding and DUF2867 domains [Nonomuraea solani]|uniref:Uncharacterized conserved protein YbjT, contains NAD(P)-binding and DUF2867 domains n=1 Tax=Nonomuraea solani TaxID=1144553 RepID=A0A1H6ETQ5_9ACTN|nr:SDR family oxidoreductase [Nonomuraea solani]SEH01240.1 Uncharacterized conserved protein YbjT, contains NAD(P)-binding and DUF2867 domains [Nonomuraea solani]
MKIVIIGGTGLIGSKVVDRLRVRGHEAVAASPATGVDTLTGEGLAAALTGAQVVVDVTNSPSFEDAAVLEFFTTSTANVLAAEARAGVGLHVVLSIVGIERLPASGYFRAKVAQEKLVEESPIPYTIVRATQFFEFVQGIADAATDGDTVRVPPAAFQPIAADDVADAITEAALEPPRSGTIEIAGPRRYPFDELVRIALTAWKDPREVVTDPRAAYFGAVLDEGSLVPAGDGAHLGKIGFEDWLARS